MPTYAQIEFVYLHNGRTRKAPVSILMGNKEQYEGVICDFDPYHITINDGSVTTQLVKNDVVFVSSDEELINIEFINKIYHSVSSKGVKHARPLMQDIFLNEVRKSKSPIICSMKNELRVRGTLIGFDDYTLLVSYESKQQLVYKNTTMTVYPLIQRGEIIRYDGEKKRG